MLLSGGDFLNSPQSQAQVRLKCVQGLCSPVVAPAHSSQLDSLCSPGHKLIHPQVPATRRMGKPLKAKQLDKLRSVGSYKPSWEGQRTPHKHPDITQWGQYGSTAINRAHAELIPLTLWGSVHALISRVLITAVGPGSHSWDRKANSCPRKCEFPVPKQDKK